jgi:hypothetical protein
MRANERTLILDPKLTLSNTEKAEPNRAKLLTDSEEPPCTCSNTDKLEENQNWPFRDIEDPHLVNARTDMALPTFTNCNTERAPPNLEKDRVLSELPKCVYWSTLIEAPMRPVSANEMADPMRAKLLNDMLLPTSTKSSVER